MRNRKYERGFGWNNFKELLKNHFYPGSSRRLRRMSVLEYASKFTELSCFTPAYVADEKLRMNHFEVRLNPSLKERMLVRHYTSYEDMYDTTVNVERAMKEKNEFYNEQRRVKRSGDQRRNHHTPKTSRNRRRISPTILIVITNSMMVLGLEWSAMPAGNPGIMHTSVALPSDASSIEVASSEGLSASPTP